jgi:hypothetical protein
MDNFADMKLQLFYTVEILDVAKKRAWEFWQKKYRLKKKAALELNTLGSKDMKGFGKMIYWFTNSM